MMQNNPEVKQMAGEMVRDILSYLYHSGEQTLASSIWQSLRTTEPKSYVLTHGFLPDDVSDVLFAHPMMRDNPGRALRLDATRDDASTQQWLFDRIFITGKLWVGHYIPTNIVGSGSASIAPNMVVSNDIYGPGRMYNYSLPPRTEHSHDVVKCTLRMVRELIHEQEQDANNAIPRLLLEQWATEPLSLEKSSIFGRDTIKAYLAQRHAFIWRSPKMFQENHDMSSIWRAAGIGSSNALTGVLHYMETYVGWDIGAQDVRCAARVSAFDVDGPCLVAMPFDASRERVPHAEERSLGACWVVERQGMGIDKGEADWIRREFIRLRRLVLGGDGGGLHEDISELELSCVPDGTVENMRALKLRVQRSVKGLPHLSPLQKVNEASVLDYFAILTTSPHGVPRSLPFRLLREHCHRCLLQTLSLLAQIAPRFFQKQKLAHVRNILGSVLRKEATFTFCTDEGAVASPDDITLQAYAKTLSEDAFSEDSLFHVCIVPTNEPAVSQEEVLLMAPFQIKFIQMGENSSGALNTGALHSSSFQGKDPSNLPMGELRRMIGKISTSPEMHIFCSLDGSAAGDELTLSQYLGLDKEGVREKEATPSIIVRYCKTDAKVSAGGAASKFHGASAEVLAAMEQLRPDLAITDRSAEEFKVQGSQSRMIGNYMFPRVSKDINNLRKLYSTFGHLFCHAVTLGGCLQTTKIVTGNQQTNETEEREAFKVRRTKDEGDGADKDVNYNLFDLTSRMDCVGNDGLGDAADFMNVVTEPFDWVPRMGDWKG
ncbi:hypothetical protein B0T17DRAFT_506951 [Bombardia bombarda]|uniref:Uncharacterized protein n=1 Tax=Bombardia bombarda TaxID=252184 RepID=A0AA39XAR2_9PEZI|nr:hypothetical protein B0T17DRAFT_506951 [Bombardia bombarda]